MERLLYFIAFLTVYYYLLESKTFVTDEEIISEAFLFYQAGFETSSTTMTFVFFELAQNPDIQETLRKEILEVLNKHNGIITYDSLMKMDYLDRVISGKLVYKNLNNYCKSCESVKSIMCFNFFQKLSVNIQFWQLSQECVPKTINY